MQTLENLTAEQRRYMVRMLREAADYVETAISEPVRIGPEIWRVMMDVEQRLGGHERRNRSPAA